MALYFENYVDVDLAAGRMKRSFVERPVGEGDVLANRFGVRVFRDGEPVDMTGVTCNGYFIRSDGATVIISGTIAGNTAYVDLPQECYAYEGQFSLAIKLSGGGVTGTVRIVDGTVVNTQTGQYVDPGTIIPEIETLIAAIEAAIAAIPGDYEELTKAIDTGIQRENYGIEWITGYYDTTTGAHTSSDTYKCTRYKYPRDLFPFLTNWILNNADYVSLFNGDTYAGYYNSANPTSITTLEWDSFYLTAYLAGHSNGLDNIRFVTLGNVDSIQQEAIFDLDVPVIWWRKGYYDTTTGEYDGTTSPELYSCTQLIYGGELLKYMRGWDFNSSLHYISLFNEGSYVTLVNSGEKIPEKGWDAFALTIYKQAFQNGIETIRFETLPTVEGIVSRAVTAEPHIIRWKAGYYNPSTGAYDGTTSPTTYSCSAFYYKRELLKYLQGWDFQTGYNYICLYNGGTFVRYVNSGVTSGLFQNDWDYFTLSVSLTNSQVSLPEIRFLQLMNNHIQIEVKTAAELIAAVQIAIDNTDRDRYYDIYLQPGTYELWSALDKSAITGTGDQLYHRGLELPDKCNLIGIGSVTISCTIPESDNSAEHPYTRIVSTLNMHNTENLLENIVFVGNNTRYCIHDDSGFDDNYKQLIVRNCRFEHNGTASETYMPDPRCYGAGYTTGRKALFENCVWASSGNCSTQLYVHTHAADFNKADIETVVRNNAFINANKRAIDYQVTKSGVPGGVFTVNGCYFASGCEFLIRPGSEAVDNPSAKIFGGGNSSFTLTNQVNATIYLVR